jgi:hypothetical protein
MGAIDGWIRATRRMWVKNHLRVSEGDPDIDLV